MKKSSLIVLILSSLLALCLLTLGGCGGGSSSGALPPLTLTPTATQPARGGLPSDIPIYPGARFIGNPSASQASFQAPATQEALSTYYQQQMPQNGWTTVQVQDNGQDGIILTFTKDTRTAHIVIAPGIGTNQASVLITITTS
jgi:ABC-type phosphate transport system substrate-binding protein